MASIKTGVKCENDYCPGEIIEETVPVQPSDPMQRIMGLVGEGQPTTRTRWRCSNCCAAYQQLPTARLG